MGELTIRKGKRKTRNENAAGNFGHKANVQEDEFLKNIQVEVNVEADFLKAVVCAHIHWKDLV